MAHTRTRLLALWICGAIALAVVTVGTHDEPADAELSVSGAVDEADETASTTRRASTTSSSTTSSSTTSSSTTSSSTTSSSTTVVPIDSPVAADTPVTPAPSVTSTPPSTSPPTTAPPARTVSVNPTSIGEKAWKGSTVRVTGTGCVGLGSGAHRVDVSFGYPYLGPSYPALYDHAGGDARPDGTWQVDLTFRYGVPTGSHTLSASCSVAGGGRFSYQPGPSITAFKDYAGA